MPERQSKQDPEVHLRVYQTPMMHFFLQMYLTILTKTATNLYKYSLLR